MLSKEQKRKARTARLKKQYNITDEEFEAIKAYQNHGCAICHKTKNKKGIDYILNVDHRHSDGLVRGLLCGPHNKALERFDDNADYLLAASNYILNPPAVTVLGDERFGLPGRGNTKKQRKLAKKLAKSAKK